MQFWTLTEAVCYLSTLLMVCKEMQTGIDRKPEKATDRFAGQENISFSFPYSYFGLLGCHVMQITFMALTYT